MEEISEMFEDEQVRFLWDLQIRTDRLVMANQPDTLVLDKHQRTTAVIDKAIPSD